MKFAVRYYTKSGNTKKLADEIARELNVEALDVSNKLTEDVDYLFLGSSVYAAGVDEEIKSFIKNPGSKIGQIVNFSTAALLPSTYKQVSKLCTAAGLKVSDKEFHCRGSFGALHKSHPNAEDLKNAAEFAKQFL